MAAAGILLVDKPGGMTSHDVVARARRALGTRKIGHAGTLDPMATRLLIILVGKATRVSQYLISLDKEYEGRRHIQPLQGWVHSEDATFNFCDVASPCLRSFTAPAGLARQ